MTSEKKRKPPFALALPGDLDAYLRTKAREGYRSVTAEIAMRLEKSRKEEAQSQGPAQ